MRARVRSEAACIAVLVGLLAEHLVVVCLQQDRTNKKDVVIAADVGRQSVDNAIFPQNVLSVPSSAADLILLYSINLHTNSHQLIATHRRRHHHLSIVVLFPTPENKKKKSGKSV